MQVQDAELCSKYMLIRSKMSYPAIRDNSDELALTMEEKKKHLHV